MRIVEFRPMQRNSLLGFATVEMPSGMILHDCGIYQKEGEAWARGLSFVPRICVPSRPIEFTTKEVRGKWSIAVIDALRDTHHSVFTNAPAHATSEERV